MKTASAATLVLALFLATVMMTTASLLSDYDGSNADISFADLSAGRLGALFTGPNLRNRYPSAPSVTAAFDAPSLLLVGGLVATAFYVVRSKLKQPAGMVGVAMLFLGVVPYGLGTLVLQTNTLEPYWVGNWLAVMIIGTLYTSLTAALFSLLEVTGWHKTVRVSQLVRRCVSSNRQPPAAMLARVWGELARG